MKPIRTHNAYHLGDNLVHLNFLRRVAIANTDKKFVHAASYIHLPQLRDVIADVPNVALTELEHDPFYAYCPFDAPEWRSTNYPHTGDFTFNAWRGAGGDWYNHPDRNDFVEYHTSHWFPKLADLMGVSNPVTCRESMLFDYPALINQENRKAGNFWDTPDFDVLVINSPPGSGQLAGYDEYALWETAIQICAKGRKVVCTHRPRGSVNGHDNLRVTTDRALTVTQIGNLSLRCHTIVMVSTGPSWPTFNRWNASVIQCMDKASHPRRIILLEPERVNLALKTTHVATVQEAADILKKEGLM